MSRCLTVVIAALLLAVFASPARAGGLIDFETLPDDTPTVDQQEIGTEYASLGVTFALINGAGDVIGTPNIAKVGAPETAFASCNGPDTPLPGQGVGESFLTDNTGVGGVAGSLLITYASPVAQAAGVILDTDCRSCGAGGNCGAGCEQWTIEARDANGDVIDTFIIDGEEGAPGPPCNDANGPGDARADGWFFDHETEDIYSVVIRYTSGVGSVGLAFDNFTPASIPELQATADISPDALCYGQVVELNGSALGGVPPYAFRWQEETAPDVWSDVATGQSAVIVPPSDTVLRLLVEDVAANSVSTTPVLLTVEPVLYEVSQESAPGADDFARNVLGTIVPYESTDTAADYYGWTSGTTPFSGPEPRLTDNRSHLFLVKGGDGLTLYVVHDSAAGNAGGRAETQIDLLCDTADFLVRDDATGDPSDIFNVLNGGSLFQMRNVWVGLRTDGYAIGVLDCGWTAEMQFVDLFGGDPTFSGLDTWVAFSNGGGELALALEEGRRVRITARIGCPADLDLSGAVDVVDLLALLSLWGPCPPPCSADLDCDGQVGVTDLLDMLSQWGPC